MRATWFVMACLVLSLSACSVFNPYIKPPPPTGTASDGLEAALGRAKAIHQSMDAFIEEQNVLRAVANGGVFAGALATMGLAAFQAAKDAIVAAGMFTPSIDVS